MNKQINIFTILCIIILCTVSCGDDYLSPEPTAALSETNFFKNEANLKSYVLGIYDGIQGVNTNNNSSNRGVQIEFMVTEMRSDNSTLRSLNPDGQASTAVAEFPTFNVQANNAIVYNYYSSFFNIIFRANKALKYIDLASEENRNAIEAEVKFIRAYAYFNLVRLFGAIPLVTETSNLNDKDVLFNRITESKIYELIFSDFEFAVNNIVDNGSKNLASKAAAQGLLAKAYLTPEGITNKQYTKAKDLLAAIIDSKKYSLESDFSDVFYNENNNETIFSIGYISGDERNSQNFSGSFLNSAAGGVGGYLNYATPNLVESLSKYGGNRRDKTIRVAKDNKGNETEGVYNTNKFLPDGQEDQLVVNNVRLSGNDWIVLRYSDILLLYVEATLEGKQTTEDAKAIEYFKMIRNRAGTDIPIANVKQIELLRERRVEFAFENQRLFDLLRIGKAKANEVLENFANSTSYTSDDLLLPLPAQEINISNN